MGYKTADGSIDRNALFEHTEEGANVASDYEGNQGKIMIALINHSYKVGEIEQHSGLKRRDVEKALPGLIREKVVRHLKGAV